MRQKFTTDPNLLEMMEDLRHDGWCVVLKCLPYNLGWVLEGSRSEYDAPSGATDRIGVGKWCCEATWMGEEFKHGHFTMGDTATQAMAKLWWGIRG